MTFRVRIDPVALRQIEQFAIYLRDYSEDFAVEQIERLDRILHFNLGESPLTWSYFPLTGAPLSWLSVPRRSSNPILDHLHRRRGYPHGRHPVVLEHRARPGHDRLVKLRRA